MLMKKQALLIRTYCWIAMAILLTSCSVIDDDPPDTWIEATVPDLFFIAPLKPRTGSANVVFATAPLDRSMLPPDFTIRVASLDGEGSNYYDDSLEYGELKTPVEGEERWLWSGSVPILPTQEPVFAGVQISGMPYQATRSTPLAHKYCMIDLLGSGAYDCGPWADVIFHNRVLCRGIVGQMIGCHGLGFEIVPDILVFGIAQRDPWLGGRVAAKLKNGEYHYMVIPGATFTMDETGWSYQPHGIVTRRGEPAREPPPVFGPFATPEDAARDARERLGLNIGTAHDLSSMPVDTGFQRILSELRRRGATDSAP